MKSSFGTCTVVEKAEINIRLGVSPWCCAVHSNKTEKLKIRLGDCL